MPNAEVIDKRGELSDMRDKFTLTGKKAFVCDLDGTLFMGSRPIAPAVRFVQERAAVLLNADPELDYVATHGDKCCPSEEGPIPDIGGIIALMRATNGVEPRHVFGKPSPSLLAPVLRRFAPSQIVMVGDRLYTDKAMADNAGIDFICVLSGETTRESLAAYKGTPPAVVLETLGELL